MKFFQIPDSRSRIPDSGPLNIKKILIKYLSNETPKIALVFVGRCNKSGNVGGLCARLDDVHIMRPIVFLLRLF